MSITLTLHQAQTIVEFFGGEESIVTITESDTGHSGPGLYLHSTEYADEGSIFLAPEPDPVDDWRDTQTPA
jgi:hypothetical protein